MGSDDPSDSGSGRVIPLRPVQDESFDLSLDDELGALRAALDDLRLEIRSRFALRDEAAEPASDLQVVARDLAGEWLELFDDLRRRLGNFGIRERGADVDDFGYESATVESARAILDFLFDRYWRVECLDFDALPSASPALFVANGAGLLPYDGLMLAHALERRDAKAGRPRFLVADWLITLPFAQPALARVGGVRACRENAERLLRSGHSVIAFPEGEKGATKLFRERYRLQRFGRGGAVRIALELGLPLVPIGLAGPEEAHPLLHRARLPGQLVGLPFVPVTPTFPLLGPIGLVPLPSKWVIAAGEPLDLAQYDSRAAVDDAHVDRLTEELRERIRERIRAALERRESVWG
jgi:1-acyl-sn-glycerol-3-phosphate acyltransferase